MWIPNEAKQHVQLTAVCMVWCAWWYKSTNSNFIQ